MNILSHTFVQNVPFHTLYSFGEKRSSQQVMGSVCVFVGEGERRGEIAKALSNAIVNCTGRRFRGKNGKTHCSIEALKQLCLSFIQRALAHRGREGERERQKRVKELRREGDIGGHANGA